MEYREPDCVTMNGTYYCKYPDKKHISDFCGYCCIGGYTWERYEREILNENKTKET